MAVLPTSELRIVADGLDHPEGVAAGPDGAIYAGGEAGQVYRFSLDGERPSLVATTGGFCLGIALDADSNSYVCDIGRRAVMRVTRHGQVSVYADTCDGQPMVSPNYPVFDEAGILYVSDSGDWDQANGRLYRIDPDRQVTVFCRSLPRFPNGMALGPDGRSLYVIESQGPTVSRVPIDSDGRAGPPELVLTLPDCVPDGVALDEHGTLYVTCYQPNRIYRAAPRGEAEILLSDPSGIHLTLPTNIAFGGPGRETLLIANLGARHISALRVGVGGLRLPYPELQ